MRFICWREKYTFILLKNWLLNFRIINCDYHFEFIGFYDWSDFVCILIVIQLHCQLHLYLIKTLSSCMTNLKINHGLARQMLARQMLAKLKWPSTNTCWVRPLSKESTHLTIFGWSPYLPYLDFFLMVHLVPLHNPGICIRYHHQLRNSAKFRQSCGVVELDSYVQIWNRVVGCKVSHLIQDNERFVAWEYVQISWLCVM